MTQTATFPDLESLPNVSDQALLYFSSTMGTLTEVDVVTSGSFQSQLSAENLGPTSRTIEGTTAGNLSINVPTGAMPVSIPPVTEAFDASAFDGTLDDGGTSGKTLAPVTSRSTPQTTVLTSPADLAAFTGHFRIPISVSGHATGSIANNNGDVSGAFKTDTSATITVIYHYIPNLPGTDQTLGSPPTSPPGSGTSAAPGPSTDSGTSAAPGPSTGTIPNQGSGQAPSALSVVSSTGAGHHRSSRTRVSVHRPAPPLHRLNPSQLDLSLHHPRRLIRIANHK
jgi:hypothetical protein